MGPSNPSQAARRLEETPDTRAEIQAGTSTLANAAALVAAAEECGARRVDENMGLWAEAARANPDDFRKRSPRLANEHGADRGHRGAVF